MLSLQASGETLQCAASSLLENSKGTDYEEDVIRSALGSMYAGSCSIPRTVWMIFLTVRSRRCGYSEF